MPESIIKSVSLISVGPAKGHIDKETGKPVFVDPTTLDQIMKALEPIPSIKLREDHGSGVGATLGYVDNFRREERQIYGDLHFYENAEDVPLFLEIAEKNPSHLGLSLEFGGKDEESPDLMFARCAPDGVIAVALVSDAAANKSLFSALHPTATQLSAEVMPTPGDPKNPATLPDISTLAAQITDLAAKCEGISALTTQLTKLACDYEEMSKKLAECTPCTQPADQNPAPKVEVETERKFSDDEAKKIAEFSAQATVKMFAAQFGSTFLPASSPAIAPESSSDNPVKKFEAIVSDLAVKEFSNNAVSARAAAMTRFPVEYGASRPIAPKK